MSTIEKKSLKVGQYVGMDHVNTVIRTYKQERWKYNTERLGKADSLSLWYSVEELEDYIAHIKEHGADGIRLYFAAYPENFEKVPEYAGRQTMVMVATKNKGGKNNKDLYIGDGKEAKVLAYNYAAMCPPFCTLPPTPEKPPTGSLSLKMPELGVTIIDQGKKGMTIV